MRDALTATRTLAFCIECSAVHVRPRDAAAAERVRRCSRRGIEPQHRVRYTLIAKCTRPVDLSYRGAAVQPLHAVAGAY